MDARITRRRQLQCIFSETLAGYHVRILVRLSMVISGVAITMKYNQMNTELMRNKKLSDKIATLKKQLLNI